jgi:hypothetical protein
MESPLSVVLKSKRRKSKPEIRVCSDCGFPLIWTFAFDYCERYCVNCGSKGGMFGTGEDIPATRELIFQKKLVDAIWKVIYGKKGLVPTGGSRTNCKICNSNSSERHYYHMTKAEKEWDSIARKYLKLFSNNLLTTPHPVG